MRLRFWRRRPAVPAVESTALAPALTKAISHRQFVKVVLGAIGGAGLGLAGSARPAQATYNTGPTTDTVDRNLTVNGDLIVLPSSYGPGNVGIGTSNLQGKLNVAGEIRVNGAVAIDGAGVAGQSYYAP